MSCCDGPRVSFGSVLSLLIAEQHREITRGRSWMNLIMAARAFSPATFRPGIRFSEWRGRRMPPTALAFASSRSVFLIAPPLKAAVEKRDL